MIARISRESFALRLAFAIEIADAELEEATTWEEAVERVRSSLHELFDSTREYERFAATNAFFVIADMLWKARICFEQTAIRSSEPGVQRKTGEQTHGL